MTTMPKLFVHTACIILLMTAPGSAFSQGQTTQAASPPAATATEPVVNTSSPTGTAPDQQKPEQQVKPVETAAPTEQAAETTSVPPAAETAPYAVQKGDTLWDIANTFLKDPFLWPFIWKANPNITNPDLIYPGSMLAIPSLGPIERALKAPSEETIIEKKTAAAEETAKQAPEEKQAAIEPPLKQDLRQKDGIGAARVEKPKSILADTAEETSTGINRLILPEEQPLPLIDKYAMLSAGYVTETESEGAIVGTYETGKSIVSYDDIVYVKMRMKENTNIGDKFLVYVPLNKVKHPRTGKYYGRLIKGLGILQITHKDAPDVFTARISLSFDAIEKNNLLAKYQEPSLIYHSTEKKVKEISGYILEVTDHRTINSQIDVVYLDRGVADGVQPGDKFAVYEDLHQKGFPRKKIGDVRVFLVEEHTSTAIVTKSIDALVRGNAIEFVN